MKEYIQDLLNGYVYIDAETHNNSIQWIFRPGDIWDPPVPFEGNCGEVYEDTSGYINEQFFEPDENQGYFLLIDDVPNEEGQLAVLGLPNGKKHYYYSEKPFDYPDGGYSQFGRDIGQLLTELEQQGNKFEWIGTAAIQPRIYKLNDGWVIVFSEVVYAKHPNHIGIIAKTHEEANRIFEALFLRLRETPISRLSRRELFHDIKFKDDYNGSEEANKLRYQYLKKIITAYEKCDFSDLFDDLADDCVWGQGHGKSAVINYLVESATSMKNRKYRHKCTIVQVGRPIAPVECNTKPDGTGQIVMLGLLYNQGEICMVDQTPVQTLFFRMTIAPNGKIREYYATLPSGNFYPINDYPNGATQADDHDIEEERQHVYATYVLPMMDLLKTMPDGTEVSTEQLLEMLGFDTTDYSVTMLTLINHLLRKKDREEDRILQKTEEEKNLGLHAYQRIYRIARSKA